MDKYLSAQQVAEILSCSKRKAYDVIYSVPHLPSPVRVSERVLRDYLERQTVYPARLAGERRKRPA